jgi:ribosomal protein L2
MMVGLGVLYAIINIQNNYSIAMLMSDVRSCLIRLCNCIIGVGAATGQQWQHCGKRGRQVGEVSRVHSQKDELVQFVLLA